MVTCEPTGASAFLNDSRFYDIVECHLVRFRCASEIKSDLLASGEVASRNVRMHMYEHSGTQLELIYDTAPSHRHEGCVGAENPGPSWSYQWEGARNGGRYNFTSQVSRIDGIDGERRRLELTAIARELLHWSAQEVRADAATERRA
jgi:hypothetical protein